MIKGSRQVMNNAEYLEGRLPEYMAWRRHRTAFRTFEADVQSQIIAEFAEMVRLVDSGDRSTSNLEHASSEVATARRELPEWVAVAEAESNLW